jgi:Holliday junction DNA helicase RuvB
MAKERIISSQPVDPGEDRFNAALRPERLSDYVGQAKLVERLKIALEAVKQRDEPMEHVLLHGPPGLGKTTLSHIIANEQGTHLKVTSGPTITKPSDLVGVLTQMQPRDVLFIDEIHRLPAAVEEYLYSAMEDFKIDVPIGSGMHSQVVTIHIKPFCLLGATTRAGMLSRPMQSRFGLVHNLDFYTEDELLLILMRSARLLEMIDASNERAHDALRAIACRSRGTPRIANRLLRRVRDFAQVRANGRLSLEVVDGALHLEGVDEMGLDELDRKYMKVIAGVYRGGPVGLEAVAANLGEDTGTLEDMVEPYLLQLGFLARTRRGRMLTQGAVDHLGLAMELPQPGDGLFDEQPTTMQDGA